MTALTAGFEGQTSGTALSTGNSDDFGDPAMTVVSAGGNTLAYSSAQSAHGSGSVQFVNAAAAAGLFGYQVLDLSQQTASIRYYLYLSALPNATAQLGHQVRHSAGGIGRMNVQSGGKVEVNAGASTIASAAGEVLATGQWYRIEAQLTGTNTGGSTTHAIQVYSLDATSQLFSVSVSGATGGGTVDNVRFGTFAGTNYAVTAYFDDISIEAGTSTAAGPVAGPPPQMSFSKALTIGTS